MIKKRKHPWQNEEMRTCFAWVFMLVILGGAQALVQFDEDTTNNGKLGCGYCSGSDIIAETRG